jgi:hypothetical protein
MNKNICVFIWFFVGILIFSLIRSHCNCDITEGYCCKAEDKPLPTPAPTQCYYLSGRKPYGNDCKAMRPAGMVPSKIPRDECKKWFSTKTNKKCELDSSNPKNDNCIDGGPCSNKPPPPSLPINVCPDGDGYVPFCSAAAIESKNCDKAYTVQIGDAKNNIHAQKCLPASTISFGCSSNLGQRCTETDTQIEARCSGYNGFGSLAGCCPKDSDTWEMCPQCTGGKCYSKDGSDES